MRDSIHFFDMMVIQQIQFFSRSEMSKNKGGRPESVKTPAEVMQTKCWLRFLLTQTGSADFNEFDRKVHSIPDDMSVTQFRIENKDKVVRWERYESQEIAPNETTLKLFDQPQFVPGSRKVYEIGPQIKGEHIPLWRLFQEIEEVRSHEAEDLWAIVNTAVPEMRELRKRGAPYTVRVNMIALLFVTEAEWQALNFKNPADKPDLHVVVKAYRQQYFLPTPQLLLAAMAMWRITMSVGESMAQMEYLIRGLLTEPYKTFLSTLEIYTEFVAAFYMAEINDCLTKGDLETAKKLSHMLKSNTLA